MSKTGGDGSNGNIQAPSPTQLKHANKINSLVNYSSPTGEFASGHSPIKKITVYDPNNETSITFRGKTLAIDPRPEVPVEEKIPDPNAPDANILDKLKHKKNIKSTNHEARFEYFGHAVSAIMFSTEEHPYPLFYVHELGAQNHPKTYTIVIRCFYRNQ